MLGLLCGASSNRTGVLTTHGFDLMGISSNQSGCLFQIFISSTLCGMKIPNGYYVSERPPVLNLTETSPCPKWKSSSRAIVLGFWNTWDSSWSMYFSKVYPPLLAYFEGQCAHLSCQVVLFQTFFPCAPVHCGHMFVQVEGSWNVAMWHLD